MTGNLPYRRSVVGVFTNDDLVLTAERADHRGQWQLPQGGIDNGESAEMAIRREMSEELGNSNFDIVKRSAIETCYDFPAELNVPICRKFRGQRQIWFHLKFIADNLPDLTRGDNEFVAWQWSEISQLLTTIVYWKRDSYQQGLQSLALCC